MRAYPKEARARRSRHRISRCAAGFLAALAIGACEESATTASAPAAAPVPAAEPEPTQPGEPDAPEYGEFNARPEELASVKPNDIIKSMRLNVTAMRLGLEVYERACAQCHGADLTGVPGGNAPDLTDADWRFAGDDLESGGGTYYPSDAEWTVRYGVRSEHPNARGLEADMLAYDPQYRNEFDLANYGTMRYLTDEEIRDVVEYVLQLSGQEFDPVMAARGDVLFKDGDRGGCYDCHEFDGSGFQAIGGANLTQPRLYLYGAERDSIYESINEGRRSIMPAFEGTLSPEEIHAVSVFVFSRARGP